MANSYFEFKQFRVEQGQTAMKVGTDGVLLGAWTNVENVDHILDVGAGTGLLSLMMAQRSHAKIVGVELDDLAVCQARENVTASPFGEQITIVNQSFQEYAACESCLFDLIISNPPFFENGIKAPDTHRSAARHADQMLPFEALVEGVSHLLSSDGRFSVVLPVWSEDRFEELAFFHNLFPSRRMEVRHAERKLPKRVLLEFGRKQKEIQREELVIRKGTEYTQQYIDLTKAFYLAF